MVKVEYPDGTPATVGAFALYDFDEDRILSRKFFSKLNLPTDKTDKEILLSFDISDVDGAEKTTKILLKVREMTKKYFERLQNHAKKLGNISQKVAYSIVENGENEELRKKFRSAKFLSALYLGLSNDVKKLYYEIQEKMYMCDAVIGSR